MIDGVFHYLTETPKVLFSASARNTFASVDAGRSRSSRRQFPVHIKIQDAPKFQAIHQLFFASGLWATPCFSLDRPSPRERSRRASILRPRLIRDITVPMGQERISAIS